MVSTGLVFFREILEIAIILGMILAATRGVPGRGRAALFGLFLGLVGSAVVAVFAGQIADAMEGMGAEVFNASILSAAALMIGWTVVWMKQHGREIAQKVQRIGHSVREGRLPLYSLSGVIAISMWREGSEIVLFMTSILSTHQETLPRMLLGGAVGFVVAASIGTALYFGLVRLSTKYIFLVTGWLLVLVTCGMAAQAAGYWVAADYLPQIVPQIWDTSAVLPQESIVGKILHSMVGYIDRPNGMQLLAYMLTFAVLWTWLGTLKGLTNKPKSCTV